MSLFTKSVDATSLHGLLVHELQDLYDAEHQILDALPLMMGAAQNRELVRAFKEHLEETKMHVTRLEDCFHLIDESPARSTCEGMKGIIKEGDGIIKGDMDGALKDAALANAGQKVEHYEIVGYTTARDHATELHLDQVASLLQDTLQEEIDADQNLAAIGTVREFEATTMG